MEMAMRSESDRERIGAFMKALAQRVQSGGAVYFAGGATAVLHGWRDTTIDIDLKAAPSR